MKNSKESREGPVIIYRGGGGLLVFRKVVGKKCDPPLQHDKKNYDRPPAKGEKNCDPPPIPFFYFHLIFFNKKNIFYVLYVFDDIFWLVFSSEGPS